MHILLPIFKRAMIYFIIATLIIALDQFTKYLIRDLPLEFEYELIGKFLRIVHVVNSGAAFGMFSGNTKFLLLVPIVVIVAAVVYITRQNGSGIKDIMEKVALTMIAAGGIGNIIDRFLFGHVTDMISFSIFPPVFNVADIAVTCGCGLMILSLFISNGKEGSK